MAKKTAITESAKGEGCTLRLHVCNFNNETTVLAHLPTGFGGMGMKAPDYHAVYACSDCHAYIDGVNKYNVDARDYLRAWAETIELMRDKGLIKVSGYDY